jgi:hypothetical protein
MTDAALTFSHSYISTIGRVNHRLFVSEALARRFGVSVSGRSCRFLTNLGVSTVFFSRKPKTVTTTWSRFCLAVACGRLPGLCDGMTFVREQLRQVMLSTLFAEGSRFAWRSIPSFDVFQGGSETAQGEAGQLAVAARRRRNPDNSKCIIIILTLVRRTGFYHREASCFRAVIPAE